MTPIEAARAAARVAPPDPARDVPCPWCRARPGKPCTTRHGGRRLDQPHPARKAAHQELATAT